jgi:thymidylate synthase
MEINPSVRDIPDFRFDDFKLTDYVAHPGIKGDISV